MGFELASLHPRNAGHEGEMVISVALPIAEARPGTDPTLLNRFRVIRRGDVRGRPRYHRGQLIPYQPHVSGVLVDPKGVDWTVGIWRYDIEVFRRAPLRDGKHLRIETQLKDGSGASLSGELGIGDLVRPFPKRTRAGCALQ